MLLPPPVRIGPVDVDVVRLTARVSGETYARIAGASPRLWCDEVAGAACLDKPFDLDDLYDVVGRYCGQAA